jgi:peptidoglycan/LPS O-acetylase OafA/YrhL
LDLLGPINPLAALAALLLAFGTAALLQRRSAVSAPAGRFASIDGLRGYLALGVFLHHGCIWYFYQHSGEWKLPPSRLYVHLGHSSVAVFFMITGFLFFSKLIDARKRPLDWLKLFVSRLLRLVPLYLVVMLLLFATVAVLSGGELQQPARSVAKQALRWLGFTMYGNPPINQVEVTKIIVAGVTWSLPYEWFFYGTLPLLALIVGVRPRWPYLVLGLVSMLALLNWHALPVHLWAFAGGIAAAWAVRSPALCRWAASWPASLVILGAAATAVAGFPVATDYAVLVLLSLAFLLVACGNTLFGLLLHPASRLLGEMAYSIYLLHGLLLFGLFHFVLGADRPGAALNADAHWAWVLALAPCLVLVSHASFRWIEAPAMRATGGLTAALRRRLQKSPDRLPA